MKSQIEMIRAFFSKEEVLLQKSYPGLNSKRLEEDFKTFLLHKKYRLGTEVGTTDLIDIFIESLKEGIPLEYIMGRAYFYKSEFYVNENVLIPRNETELLVEKAVSDLKKNNNQKINLLDIGTGSGCIPISIALDLGKAINIWATDISPKALEVSQINYFRHQLMMPKETTLNLIKTDRLKGIEKKFHYITTNPPYIKKELDRKLVHDQVDEFEPHIALYLGPDEYENWFSELFKMVSHSLLNSGVFLMEGHENHLSSLAPLAEQFGLKDVKILPDLCGADRFLYATK